jgi:hypothetical protein
MKMKIGYIRRNNVEFNPNKPKFEFKEASYTRKISSRGDKVYSKMLLYPIDYEDIVGTTNMMKDGSGLIIVQEPFILDDELKERVVRWVEWANNADPKEYELFPELH